MSVLPHDQAQGNRLVTARTFYSVGETARMFGMSAMTLYRAIEAGEFPAVRIRGRLIIPARAIEMIVDAAVRESTEVNAADFVVVAAPRPATATSRQPLTLPTGDHTRGVAR